MEPSKAVAVSRFHYPDNPVVPSAPPPPAPPAPMPVILPTTKEVVS